MRDDKNLIYKIVREDGMRPIICFICALILILIEHYQNKGEKISLDNIITLPTFTSVVIMALVIMLSQIINDMILSRLEDDMKVTKSYDALIKRYHNSKNIFLKYDNSNKNSLRLFYKIRKQKTPELLFPTIKDFDLDDKSLFVIYKDFSEYQLPPEVESAYEELLGAHHSKVNTNNRMFRVDNWTIDGNVFVINMSPTTYFKSLVTNRAIDYKLKNGTSVRDLLEYGTKVCDLKDSKLSNHLGFNGFIETSDGWIPFVKRSKKVSIGKNSYGCSVSGSLKERYVLKHNSSVTGQGIIDSMLYETQDELRISNVYNEYRSAIRLIAAYRDVMEGGKPHLLFYLKLNISKDAIQNSFDANMKKEDWNVKLTVDGKQLVWIKKEDLKEACIAPDMMVCNNKVYKMNASLTGCVVMLLDYFHRNNI